MSKQNIFSQDQSQSQNPKKLRQQPKQKTQKIQKQPSLHIHKLPQDLEKEIKEAYSLLDEGHGVINKLQLKLLLANFGFNGLNSNEIDFELNQTEFNPNQTRFTQDEVINIITQRWFKTAKADEADELYQIFDKKNQNTVGLKEIKSVFNQYLDIQINDNDINDFINECDLDKDGVLNKDEFLLLMNYK